MLKVGRYRVSRLPADLVNYTVPNLGTVQSPHLIHKDANFYILINVLYFYLYEDGITIYQFNSKILSKKMKKKMKIFSFSFHY